MALQDSLQEQSIDTVATKFNRLNLEAKEIVFQSNELLRDWGLEGDSLVYTRTALLAFLVVGCSFLLWWITRNLLLSVIHRIAGKTKS